MRIAIIGTRGIPANYGGFETFAEELAPRLVGRGHDVTVYGRSNNIKYRGSTYKGVNLKILPTISHKYLDTVVHTLLSVLHAATCKYDVVLICNAANSLFAIVPRLVGQKVLINVDGIERKRKKWNWAGRLWYAAGEWLACKFSNVVVSDAQVIQEYFQSRYGQESVMIPYGATPGNVDTTDALQKFGVKPREYVLYVSRFEPENNAHVVIEAFRQVRTDKKLVLVGDAPYSTGYKERLRELAAGDPRIIFTGFVYGKGYHEFRSNPYCYIQATEIGGTHPALIEAMGAGNCVLANGTPENVEVVDDAGLIYKVNDVQDLREKLQLVLDKGDLASEYGRRAFDRVAKNYSWERVVSDYEALFSRLLGQPNLPETASSKG